MKWIAVAALALLTLGFAPQSEPTGAQSGFTCADFTTQQQAQAVLDSVPTTAPRLDPDGDGTACESLPAAVPTTTSSRTPLSPGEALYIGKMTVIGDMYGDQLHELERLTNGADATRWVDPSWQHDMIAAFGAVNALALESQKIVPPARFKDMDTEVKTSLNLADESVILIRQAIETNDPSLISVADSKLAESNQHIQRATALLKQEAPTTP